MQPKPRMNIFSKPFTLVGLIILGVAAFLKTLGETKVYTDVNWGNPSK